MACSGRSWRDGQQPVIGPSSSSWSRSGGRSWAASAITNRLKEGRAASPGGTRRGHSLRRPRPRTCQIPSLTEALADLDRAQRLGADLVATDTERASIFQATGRYELAFTIYREAAKRQADSGSLGALATLHADRRDIAAAERLFDQSRDRYRGVSPFPVALLDFRRGVMWLKEGDLSRALTRFESATHRLPPMRRRTAT